MDPNKLARKICDTMLLNDHATAALGVRVIDVGAGRVTLSMSVRPDMVNGHKICHGGVIFSLADSACAIASNSRNQNMLLQTGTITYVNPAHDGDQLIAVGEEQMVQGRNGVIDSTVTRNDGTLIAFFRGVVRSISGHTLPGFALMED